MASAELRQELYCSICQEIYTDPVTLTCGHSFCLFCINETWDNQGKREGEFSCPECRETRLKRPEVKKNLTLCNIMTYLLPTQTKSQEDSIFCTYCLHLQAPAVKTCLLCEASLCHTHLQLHSQSEEHVLTEPTTVFANTKCSVHKKLLKYYCSEDAVCICVSCCLAKEHRGHQVEPLKDAFDQKIAKLDSLLQNLTLKRENINKTLENLQKQRESHKKASSVSHHVTPLFRDIREHLEDLKLQVLCEISSLEGHISLSFSNLIQQQEIKKDELSGKIKHMEELCNINDPLTVLQKWESCVDDLSEYKEGDKASGVDDMDQVLISETLLTAVVDIVYDLKAKTEVYMKEASDLLLDINFAANNLSVSAGMKRESVQPAEECVTSEEMQHYALMPINPPKAKRNKETAVFGTEAANCSSDTQLQPPQLEQASGILLDECTAAVNVIVSDDMKCVTWSEVGVRTETPERFQSCQVLSTNRFSSGQHYWDIETNESGYWRVGVAYPTIQRKGLSFCIGDNKLSWCLDMLCGNYSVIHDGKEEKISPMYSKQKLKRFRIYLDYDAGQLSFYQLMKQTRLLYTFTTSFTQPLCAAFWVSSGGWVRILT